MAPKAPRAKPTHPPYLEMIVGAITALKERTGSSPAALKKKIAEQHPGLPAGWEKVLSTQLKNLVAKGKLQKARSCTAPRTSCSFLLPFWAACTAQRLARQCSGGLLTTTRFKPWAPWAAPEACRPRVGPLQGYSKRPCSRACPVSSGADVICRMKPPSGAQALAQGPWGCLGPCPAAGAARKIRLRGF